MPLPAANRLAILYDSSAKLSPSNPLAILKFLEAAAYMGFSTEIVTSHLATKLLNFAGLFIRETTYLNHYTQRLAGFAKMQGLYVLDDPDDMLITCDKAAQAELYEKNGILTPKTFVIDGNDYLTPIDRIPAPYIVKDPYGCFSHGVHMVKGHSEYAKFALLMLEKLPRIVVQEFIPTDFDWRIGILGGKAIFACKYYMTPGHWKIIKHDRKGEFVDGKSETLPLEEVPSIILETAIKVANLIGNGFYGIDIKHVEDKVYVIEANDNCNVDAGVEDAIAGNELYFTILRHFQSQMEIRSASVEL